MQRVMAVESITRSPLSITCRYEIRSNLVAVLSSIGSAV